MKPVIKVCGWDGSYSASGFLGGGGREFNSLLRSCEGGGVKRFFLIIITGGFVYWKEEKKCSFQYPVANLIFLDLFN